MELEYSWHFQALLQVHLKNREIENTKLVSEVQTLKNLDGNKENMITHFKEEIGRLQLCLAEKDSQQRAYLLTTTSKVSTCAPCIRNCKTCSLLNVCSLVVSFFFFFLLCLLGWHWLIKFGVSGVQFCNTWWFLFLIFSPPAFLLKTFKLVRKVGGREQWICMSSYIHPQEKT